MNRNQNFRTTILGCCIPNTSSTMAVCAFSEIVGIAACTAIICFTSLRISKIQLEIQFFTQLLRNCAALVTLCLGKNTKT